MDFWQEFDQGILALAPMEDVTDTVFREIVMRCSQKGKLNVMMTEFVSTDGLCHEQARSKVSHRLFCNSSEMELLKKMQVKLVAQIWGTNPDKFYQAVKFIDENYSFDGIDINMGCPVAKIVKKGACSSLIKTPTLAQEIITSCKEASSLPVSVKTRTGITHHQTEEWIPKLVEMNIAALTLHGRVQKQQSEGSACWEQIALAKKIASYISPSCKVLGNGDVKSYQESLDKINKHKLDGVMIARGVFDNLFIFNEEYSEKTCIERLSWLKEHINLFNNTWQERKNFAILKKFFKIYAREFDGASVLRQALVEVHTPKEALSLIDRFLQERN